MTLFDKFKSREQLLEAFEAALKQEGDEWFIEAPNAGNQEEFTRKINELNAENKKYRQSGQERKARITELEQMVESQTAQLEELQKLNPENLREQLQTVAKEKAELKTKLPQLEKQLTELQSELGVYKTKEKESSIKTALWEEAQKMGIRPEARPDVERLWYEVDFGDDGILKTKDGRTEALTVPL